MSRKAPVWLASAVLTGFVLVVVRVPPPPVVVVRLVVVVVRLGVGDCVIVGDGVGALGVGDPPPGCGGSSVVGGTT